MEGALDFNFQPGVMGGGPSSVQVNDGAPNGMMMPQNTGMVQMSQNTPVSGVYVSASAANAAAPPSWVH